MKPSKTNGSNSFSSRRKPSGESLTNRSRLTNGSALHLSGVDGRSREARRWRDLYRQYMAETSGRHEQLCRTLASLVLQREVLDAALARGESVSIDDLLRLAGAISRTLARLGLVADTAEPVDYTNEAIRLMRETRP